MGNETEISACNCHCNCEEGPDSCDCLCNCPPQQQPHHNILSLMLNMVISFMGENIFNVVQQWVGLVWGLIGGMVGHLLGEEGEAMKMLRHLIERVTEHIQKEKESIV